MEGGGFDRALPDAHQIRMSEVIRGAQSGAVQSLEACLTRLMSSAHAYFHRNGEGGIGIHHFDEHLASIRRAGRDRINRWHTHAFEIGIECRAT
jgi:hypothetical protein